MVVKAKEDFTFWLKNSLHKASKELNIEFISLQQNLDHPKLISRSSRGSFDS
jgi:hypothetical protein